MNDLKILIKADDKASAVFAKVRGEVTGLSQATFAAAGVLRTFVPAMAGAFSLSAVAGFVRSTVNGLDALNDLKDATGESILKLSALEDVALRSGHSFDVASDALIKLNKALLEAKEDPESAAGRAIKGLGLDIKALMAIPSPVDRMQAVAQALNNFGGENKLQYNLALFSKSTREITPVLADLAEAGKLVGTVTDQDAEAADRFGKELAKLNKTAIDVSRTLAGPLVSSVNETIDKFRDGTKDAKGFWQTVLALNRTMAREQLKLLGLGGSEPNTGGATGSWGEPDKPKLPPLPDKPNKPEKVKLAKPIKADTTPDFDPYTEALRELTNTDSEKIKRLSATLGELLSLQAAGMADTGTAQAIDAVRTALEKLDPVVSRAKEAAKAVDELLGIGPDSGFSKKLDQMQELNKRLEEGKISTDAYIAAMKELDGAFAKAGETAKDAKDVGEEIGLVFSSAAGRAIEDFTNLRGILKGIASDILQIVYKNTIGKKIEDVIGGIFKDGATLASLFGSANGNAFGPGGLIPFAAGGVVTSPTLFKFARGSGIMGEAGPEAILPLKRGSDGKLGVRSGGRGAVQLSYAPVINIDSRSDRAQVGVIVAQAVAQGQQQMLEHLQAQGVLA